MRHPILIAALLSMSASSCSNELVESAGSHPPVADLQCQDEPPALTREQILAVADDPEAAAAQDQQFTVDGLMAGRSCRDALRRSCEWHKLRGLKAVDCSPLPFTREPGL